MIEQENETRGNERTETEAGEKEVAKEESSVADAEEIVERPEETPEARKARLKKARQKRNAKMYTVTAFLYGLVCSTLPIIIVELTWDRVAKAIGATGWGLGYEIFSDFFRAALIEESFKFLGFYLAFRKFKLKRQVEAMFVAGTVGLVYGLIEKAVFFNPFPVILGVVFPLHVLWQIERGRHFFNYKQAMGWGDKKRAAIEMLLATLGIFLMHGSWDAVITLADYFNSHADTIPHGDVYGVLCFIGIIAAGISFVVVTLIKTVKIAKKARSEWDDNAEVSL